MPRAADPTADYERALKSYNSDLLRESTRANDTHGRARLDSSARVDGTTIPTSSVSAPTLLPLCSHSPTHYPTPVDRQPPACDHRSSRLGRATRRGISLLSSLAQRSGRVSSTRNVASSTLFPSGTFVSPVLGVRARLRRLRRSTGQPATECSISLGFSIFTTATANSSRE